MSRRCGAKHSFKSKCTKHRMFGPLFEAQMSKKIARRCGAKCIYKSKGTKHCMFGPLFEAQMSKKSRAAVAQSTCGIQNDWNTACSDHFLKLRCRKIARRCGAERICKAKGAKHCMIVPLFEAQMSKNRTLLWRGARLQVKMLKNWGVRATFWSSDVEKLVRKLVSQSIRQFGN